MGKKDLSQKNLLNYGDVAADIINVLLYGGECVVSEDTLVPAFTETLYGEEGERLRNQMEDVAKYNIRDGGILAMYLIANQTWVDSGMVFRRAGYVGGAYRMQYGQNHVRRCPVIHMVLYWGRRRWKAPRSIRSYFRNRGIPEQMWKYIDDLPVQVYEMCHLTAGVREKFTSDMRIVAEYLAAPDNVADIRHPIAHLEALLEALYELSEDREYLKIVRLLRKVGQLEKNEKGERWQMCELLRKYREDGLEAGRKEGHQEGRKEGLEAGRKEGRQEGYEAAVKAVVTTCRRLNASFEVTLEELKRCFKLDDESARQQMKLYW